MENILDRFLRYVAVDTQSDPESESQPSSARQLDLLKMLCAELQGMGVEASLDEYGYVMASIPSNCGKDVPSVGFIAHVDTSPDASGKDIRPQIIRNYDGGDILLNAETGLSLKTDEFPELKAYAGQTIITTDGTTPMWQDSEQNMPIQWTEEPSGNSNMRTSTPHPPLSASRAATSIRDMPKARCSMPS